MEQTQNAQAKKPTAAQIISQEVTDLLTKQLERRVPKKARKLAGSVREEVTLMSETGLSTLRDISKALKRDPELAAKSIQIWLKTVRGKSLSTAEEARKFFTAVLHIWYEDAQGVAEARKDLEDQSDDEPNVPAGEA